MGTPRRARRQRQCSRHWAHRGRVRVCGIPTTHRCEGLALRCEAHCRCGAAARRRHEEALAAIGRSRVAFDKARAAQLALATASRVIDRYPGSRRAARRVRVREAAARRAAARAHKAEWLVGGLATVPPAE